MDLRNIYIYIHIHIYTHTYIYINDQTIDLKKFRTDEKLEICTVEIKLKSTNIILGCKNRAPSGNLLEFLDILDDVLGYLYHPLTELITCGDINVNYLRENKTKLNLIQCT